MKHASLSVAALGTVALLALPACYQPARGPETRFRAEYGCGEVESRLLGGGAVQVSGCGQQATYVCADDDRNGQVCIREQSSPTAGGAAAEPPPSPGRLHLEGTMVDGGNAVRLRFDPSGFEIIYAPASNRDSAGFSTPSESCSQFYLRHPGGQIGSLDTGLSLVDLASLPDEGQVVVVACDDIIRLTEGERGELTRFLEHAMRLRSGS